MLKASTKKYLEISNKSMEDINKMDYETLYKFATSERMLKDLIINCNNIELMRDYLINHRTY